MIVLTIRTDKPEAEIGLFNDDEKLEYIIWTAHRQLAETLHQKIEAMLKTQGKSWKDIQAIGCFKGPGSFTGLRIGLTVANALAFSLRIPIVGEMGENWVLKAINRLKEGDNDTIAKPEYGRDPHITQAKK